MSSMPILILMLFLFTVGETKTIIPSMIVVILYVFLELPDLILEGQKQLEKEDLGDYSDF